MAEIIDGRKRIRKKFGSIHEVAAMPNLIEVQKDARHGRRTGLRGLDQRRDPLDFEQLQVSSGDQIVRLGDIAEVIYGAPALSYGRVLNREPAIAFWIQKASGYNTVEVCRAIEKELDVVPGSAGFEPHQDVQAGRDRYAPVHITLIVLIWGGY